MTTFTINQENNISTFTTEEEAAQFPDVERFRSVEELAELAANWQNARLVEIWNGLPGVVQVKKFTDRATAVNRIWKAVQQFAESAASVAVPAEENVIQVAEPVIEETVTAEEPAASTPAFESPVMHGLLTRLLCLFGPYEGVSEMYKHLENRKRPILTHVKDASALEFQRPPARRAPSAS